jgi:hypothetical protein
MRSSCARPRFPPCATPIAWSACCRFDWRPELIINRLRPQLVRKGKMLSVEDVNGILRLPLLGVIADEPGVIVATNKGEPLALDPASETGAAYRAIAAKLAGEDGRRAGGAGCAERRLPLSNSARSSEGARNVRLFQIALQAGAFLGRDGQGTAAARPPLRPPVACARRHRVAQARPAEPSSRATSRSIPANADVTFEQREREVAMLASVPITAVRERPKPSPDLLFALEPSSWPVRENGAEPVSGQLLGSDELAAESGPEPAPEREPEMAAESRAEEAPLELAVATVPKPKPARSGNAAGTRRRRRKKYAAATNAAKAKHPHPQQLGGQASAQA